MVRKLTITVDDDAQQAGYRAMAADRVREAEATDWADALIGGTGDDTVYGVGSLSGADAGNYVLPGAVMRWPAPGPLASESALQVRVNGGAQVQSIAPGR